MLFRDDLKRMADDARARVFARCGDDVDFIISTDPLHVGYLGGYRSILFDFIRSFRSAVIVSRSHTVLVTGASDAAPALEVLRDPGCIYRYGEFYVSSTGAGADLSAMPKPQSSFGQALQAALRAVVPANAAIGLDCSDDREARDLVAEHAHRISDARQHIILARSIKTASEIERMRVAASITERGLGKAFDAARPGMTELELSSIIVTEIVAGGGIPRFVSVTAGERSALVDAYATTTSLKPGDLIRVDVGCTVDGYYADLARTAVVGEPSRTQADRYAALAAGERAQLDLARAGITAGDLFDVAVTEVRKGALPDYQRSHCGHGLGIAAHEFPTLGPAARDVEIESGMVLCVETPYYELGWGGMMVEDIIVIRDGGNEPLTKLPRELRRI